jgi:ABC-type bacteriocin/lantibiotic exporter with double-glycine peptidase domain
VTAVRWFGAPILTLIAAGCTSVGTSQAFDPADLQAGSGWIVVRGVPVGRQTAEAGCGIAALGMIFGYWSIEEWPRERIEQACPVVEGRGSRARDLRACARDAGLEAHLIHGSWEDLLTELRSGRPVIVGLLKSYRGGNDPHYEVLVALHPGDRRVVTLDPRHGWRQNSLHGFLTEWEGTTHLLLIFSAPGRPSPSGAIRDAGGTGGSAP